MSIEYEFKLGGKYEVYVPFSNHIEAHDLELERQRSDERVSPPYETAITKRYAQSMTGRSWDFVDYWWNHPDQDVLSNYATKTRPSKLKGHSKEFVLKRRNLKVPGVGSNRKVSLQVKMKFEIDITPRGIGYIRKVILYGKQCLKRKVSQGKWLCLILDHF